MKHQKLFSIILLVTALALSACAAYFSVYGIAGLFSGALWSVAVMAGALEIAKLVTASFLFRFWDKTKTFLKTYMSIGVIVLLLITSAGIFGFLSSAYQKSKTQNIVLTQKMEIIESQKENYTKNIEQSRERIAFLTKLRNEQENRLSGLLDNENVTRSVIQLQEIQGQTAELIEKTDNDVKAENDKIDGFMQSILDLEQQVSDLKIESLDQKDITTFKFVAESLDMEMDSVVKYFMLALIFVFDPLAIAMLLAYNTIVMQLAKDEKEKKKSEPIVDPDVIRKEMEVVSELSDVIKKELEVVSDKKKANKIIDKILPKKKEEPVIEKTEEAVVEKFDESLEKSEDKKKDKVEEIDYGNKFLAASMGIDKPQEEVIKKEEIKKETIVEKNDVSVKDNTNYSQNTTKKNNGFKKIRRKDFSNLRKN